MPIKPDSLPIFAPVELPSSDCHRTLTETEVHDTVWRFTKTAAHCSVPAETADVYQLVQANPTTGKEDILWEYRVPVDQSACAEPYACYTGADAQFLSLGHRHFLIWDGDLFALEETDDGIDAHLMTQLLPQFGHPLGMALRGTQLNPLDWETAQPFQPVNQALQLSHGENPVLYAQNFLPTRSFNATVELGEYKKSVMVPAGSQVGPIEIGDFTDRAYTPVLSTVRWTPFHHLSEPVYCKVPYTVMATTNGMVVGISEDAEGHLQCAIHFQEIHL